MPGIQELQSRRIALAPVKRRPLNLAIVTKSLKHRRQLIHLAMREQGIFGDAQFLLLPFHHVDRVVQDTFHQEIAQLRHQHMRLRMLPHRHGQRADVVMVTMSQGDRVNRFSTNLTKERHAFLPVPLRMRPRVHQQIPTIDPHTPSTRPDIRITIQVDQTHSDAQIAHRRRGRNVFRPTTAIPNTPANLVAVSRLLIKFRKLPDSGKPGLNDTDTAVHQVICKLVWLLG